ncbi:MAG: hypothetical protein WA160_02965 [Pseudobdellovibrio sp.]
MSRAVIDQSGVRIIFFGILLSLVLGLSLKTQISPVRIRTLLQESVNRLEKDFIIDFVSAEVVLSDWGLPLPSLQISSIRVSPKKSSCQDSQIYIDKLIVPISLSALVTSTSLITEIDASRVELRISDLSHCFDGNKKFKKSESVVQKVAEVNISPAVGSNISAEKPIDKTTDRTVEKESEENIFNTKTAALLKKINIDQLKIIFKKNPTQALDLRHVSFDLSYEKDQLSKLDMTSQIYALKDLQSDLTYFKGDLSIQFASKKNQQIEAVAKLNGRLLDGEVQVFALFNSLSNNVKLDMKFSKVAIKPLLQMKLIEASVLNFPMTFDFRGYGYYQFGPNQVAELKLSDIEILGEKTHILIDELAVKSEKNSIEVKPFNADIQRLDVNKLVNLEQTKSISQSIENFGEISGKLKYKKTDQISLEGAWSGLEFIFANRGYREIQKLDAFDINLKLDENNILAKLDHFIVNQKEIIGKSELSYNLESANAQCSADFDGIILNEKVWSLLTQVPQSPQVKVHWNYKKNKDERHQMTMAIDHVSTNGLKFSNVDINFIQSLQDGISSSVVINAKSNHIEVEQPDLKINLLTQIFNEKTNLNEKRYEADYFHINLKGSDWRNMNFELESHLKSESDLKLSGSLKAKGDWAENDTIAATLLLQGNNKSTRYRMTKDKDSELGILEL